MIVITALLTRIKVAEAIYMDQSRWVLWGSTLWPSGTARREAGGSREMDEEARDGYVCPLFLLPSGPGWPLAADALHLPDPGPPAAAHRRCGQPPSCLIREAVPPGSWTCVLPLTSDLLAPLGLEGREEE